MSRGVQTFKQGDITKALKGAEKAGLKVQRAAIGPDGRIVLDFTEQDQQSVNTTNEWDSIK